LHALTQRIDKRRIGALRQQSHRRVAARPGEDEGRGEERGGDRDVRPGVQRPLAVPRNREIGERREVRDRPLIAVGTARASEVADEVEVDGGEGEECGAAREHRGDRRRHDREQQVVRERVVVIGPPEQRVARVAREQLRQEAEAVEVGRERGGNDDRAVAFRETRHRLGEAPAGERVGDGVHEGSTAGYGAGHGGGTPPGQPARTPALRCVTA